MMTAAASSSPSSSSLKEVKELFVSGHEGTEPQELLLVCATVPAGFWLMSLIMTRRFRPFLFAHHQQLLYYRRPITLEAITFWIPMILCQSNLLYPWGVIYLGTEVGLCILLELFTTSRNDDGDDGNDDSNDNDVSNKNRGSPLSKHTDVDPSLSPPSLPPTTTTTMTTTTTATLAAETYTSAEAIPSEATGYLSTYRASLLYLTFVAILAVDFRFFPRRFAKSETRGYGLMDLGAASFVVAAGLVSSRARNQSQQQHQQQEAAVWRRIFVYRTLPLVGMGLLRLVTHKSIEYQEHASEYGVHWNFFFTLAILPLIVSLLPGPSWILPSIFLCGYQWILSSLGIQEWIENGTRTCNDADWTAGKTAAAAAAPLCHFFAANREGILGCVGYASLYMLSEWIASLALWSIHPSKFVLWLIWGVVVSVLYILLSLGIDVSRRSTNASFCCWTLVVNLPILALLLAIYQRHPGPTSLVTRAVNRHRLLCFIVANLLTGAVNISINNTPEVQDGTALAILIAYMTAIGVVRRFWIL